MSLHPPEPELTDGVVHLRNWRETDLDCVRLAATDARIPKGTSVPAVFTPEEGVAFIRRQWSRRENDEGISLAITSAKTDVAVGLIVLLRHHCEGVYGIGYWLVPGSRGNGFARRAVAMLVQWGIQQTNVQRIEAHVEPSNEASWRTLERAGFCREGLLRNYLNVSGRVADAFVYSVVG